MASSSQSRRWQPNAPLHSVLWGRERRQSHFINPDSVLPRLGSLVPPPIPWPSPCLFTQRRTGISSSSLCHRYVLASPDLPLRASPCPHIHGPCFSPLPPSRDPSPAAASLANLPMDGARALRLPRRPLQKQSDVWTQPDVASPSSFHWANMALLAYAREPAFEPRHRRG